MEFLLLASAGVGLAVGLGLLALSFDDAVRSRERKVWIRSGLGLPAVDGVVMKDVETGDGRRVGRTREHLRGERGGADGSAGLWRRRGEKRRWTQSCQRDFPSMLEVISLGMHAGLSFDGAIGLYASRFPTDLARTCADVVPRWRRGLVTREEGLEELAREVDLPAFSRFCALVLRSLRFGAPLTDMLADLARDARNDYRAEREKRVAKAPVRMLIPTAVCILPAMLLLVLGPVILELVTQMG